MVVGLWFLIVFMLWVICVSIKLYLIKVWLNNLWIVNVEIIVLVSLLVIIKFSVEFKYLWFNIYE